MSMYKKRKGKGGMISKKCQYLVYLNEYSVSKWPTYEKKMWYEAKWATKIKFPFVPLIKTNSKFNSKLIYTFE